MDADVIIVGGGIVGLWTLYGLAKQGVKCILFEQFPYPHTRGSSHGQSRIARYIYAEEEYARMMPEAFDMWKELQSACDQEFLTKLGVLRVFNMYKNEGVVAFHRNLDQMDRYAPDVEIIPGESIEARFPGLKFDSKHKAIYDENGGLMKADKSLEILRVKWIFSWTQKLCKDNGARISEGEEVLSVAHINDNKVEIETSKRTYFSRSVILACGAYTNKLLRSCKLALPLKVMKADVLYWRDKSQSACYSFSNGFPAVSYSGHYSVPSYEYPGLMKLCRNAIIAIDVEKVERSTANDLEKERLEEFKTVISEQFPDIDVSGPVLTEPCIFTRTPDWGFIIDRHPQYCNIIIGAGFSGHGFKTAPVVGKMLGNMALGQEPSHCLKPFSIRRFNAKL